MKLVVFLLLFCFMLNVILCQYVNADDDDGQVDGGNGSDETSDGGNGSDETGDGGNGSDETGDGGNGSDETGDGGNGSNETGDGGNGSDETSDRGNGSDETGDGGNGSDETGDGGNGSNETGDGGNGSDETGDGDGQGVVDTKGNKCINQLEQCSFDYVCCGNMICNPIYTRCYTPGYLQHHLALNRFRPMNLDDLPNRNGRLMAEKGGPMPSSSIGSDGSGK
ncbi:uncharacterized protein LOC128953303 [Oppia nitens]|uniref:uncharacterized protein LOC128953303 n=1 Tax=Oppia nitens TaxID=1686743 RepID=UPI0023D98978|nr:uncharacterized protein LOC128953303 [Oppia nitens]